MNGRRETGLQFSIREAFNVGFLSSGVTLVCLNARSGEDACEERCVDNVCECWHKIYIK